MWWLHHRSNRTDAIPLMFIQRWPGNFMEVGNILPGLLSAPNASMPAFDVVAPSIPNLSFSPAPLKPGWGARETGSASNALVQQLGYSKFVIQGGDIGGAILRHMAGDDPSPVVSVIDNMWVVAPNATDLQRSVEGFTTADENLTITNLIRFDTEVSRISSRARDVTPAGRDWHDRQPGGERDVDLQFEDAITWSTMYYIQGPYGGMHFYKGMSEKVSYSFRFFHCLPLL